MLISSVRESADGGSTVHATEKERNDDEQSSAPRLQSVCKILVFPRFSYVVFE